MYMSKGYAVDGSPCFPLADPDSVIASSIVNARAKFNPIQNTLDKIDDKIDKERYKINHDAVENVPYNEEVDFPDEFKRVEKELLSLYKRKNHDYGNSFHTTWLEEGVAMARIRLSDKLARFKKLSKGEDSKVKDESIRDTLMDLAAYSIMTIIEMNLEKGGITNGDEKSSERSGHLGINGGGSCRACSCCSEDGSTFKRRESVGPRDD